MPQLRLDGQPAKKRAKNANKGTKFDPLHAIQYGLKVVSVNATTREVESVACRFCIAFRRDVGPTLIKATGKMRAAVSTKKVWGYGSLRSDLYAKHHDSQHRAKWGEYQVLATEDKDKFFQSVLIPFTETLPASFETEGPLKFTVAAPIVDVINGDLLFHPDDVSKQAESRDRALSMFHFVGDEYHVAEKHPSRFRLCVRFMGRGASFRMAAGLIDDVKEETDISRYRGCTEHVAARYARLVCAVALQHLSALLKSTWAVSFAFDTATHQGKSYVDIRCRFSTKSSLHNCHLIAIPLHCRHTAQNIFDLLLRFLDSLLPMWRHQVLGVSTDGAATMIGSVKGVVTRMESEAKHSIVRVWCGLHQLDLKMQIIFKQSLEGSYLDKLHALIGFLRRQYNLISDMQTTCPKVADTRWLSMFSVVDWLCKHEYRVRKYLDETNASCAPNRVWWIFLFAMREIAKEAHAVSISLQGFSTLVQQQQDRLVGLQQKLAKKARVMGPLTTEQREKSASEGDEVCDDFAVSHADVLLFIERRGITVCKDMSQLTPENKQAVIRAVARLFVVSCSSIHTLTHMHAESVPVVLKMLVATSMRGFTELLDKYGQRLTPFVGEAGVHKIGEEFKDLLDYYEMNSKFRHELDDFDKPLAKFDEM